MRVRYGICLLIFSAVVLLCSPYAAAQRPTLLDFGEIPCDSTACNALVFRNTTSSDEQIRSLRFRDGTDFRIDSSQSRPGVIPAGGEASLQVCFSPTRRGTISDSLLVVIATASGVDSVHVRVTGRAIGPEVSVTPGVLNFPKTLSGASSAPLQMTVSNSGERPFQLTAAALPVPLPFRVTTALPVAINPGQSVVIDVVFEPTTDGVYATAVNLLAGCNRQVRLAFNGVTDIVGIGALLRSSKTRFDPANNERISCGVSRCTDVTMSNVGTVPLVIDSLAWVRNGSGFTISNAVTLPITVEPGSQQSINVCFEGDSRGLVRDTLLVRSNTRNSIAFGLVLDVSSSMDARFDCSDGSSPKRIEEARKQAKNFLETTLLHIPTINLQDEVAINEFSDSTGILTLFSRRAVTTASRQDAVTAVDTISAWGTLTFTGRGLLAMMNSLEKSQLRDRVIVLLTDGTPHTVDLEENPPSYLISEANKRGIRIFAIGISVTGEGASYLSQLVRGTQGAFFRSNDCDSLQDAFRTITDIVSRGTLSREPFAVQVAAPVVVSTGSLNFDSTYIHTQVCDTITLTNVGEGDAVVDNVTIAGITGTNEFVLPPGVPSPLVIPENGQVRVPVCFTPAELRERTATVSMSYNSCQQAVRFDTLRGVGYAIANLRLTGEQVALPGDRVVIPIYGDSTLTGYGVDTIRYRLRWNRTMLLLRNATPGPAMTGAAVSLQPVVDDGRFATTEIVITGNDLSAPGQLALVEFQMLRGDTLAVNVELTEGTFQNGNPRTLLSAGTALVAYDSTCFRDSKAVRRRTSAKVIAGEMTPTPAEGGEITLPVIATAETNVAVEVYAMNGTLVRPAEHYRLHAGNSEVQLDVSQLPAGRYYALIRTADGDIHLRTLILAQ